MKGKFKRIIAYIIVFTLLFSVNINIYADLIESQNEDVVSEESGEPEEQGELEELDEPELPEEPEDPEEPELPEEPQDPEEPEAPEEPEDTQDPENPIDPEEPVDPEEPLDPEDPLDPEVPIEPENPEVPEIPVIPEVPIVLEFQYEIDFLVVDTLEPVPGLESITGIAELGDIIDIPHPEAEGYMILEDQLTELVIEEDEELNKVIIYYELIPLVENYQYEIDFLVVDTLEPVPGLEPMAGTAALGDIIDIPHPEAEGYKILENQLTELIIEEDEELNRVVIFYEPIKNLGSLIINHIYYSNDELTTEVEVKELEIDQEVVPEEFALSRDDLEYAGSDVEGSLIIGIETVEMNLYYNSSVPAERQEREDVDFFNQRLRMRLMNNGPEPNEPGAVFIDKYAEWVDKENGLGKVTLEVNGNPIQKGSDVLLILDSSGSMSGNRMTKTKAAAKAFVEELYEQNGSLDSDNRIALITFSDNASKYPNVNNGEVFLGVDDSVGQRDAEEYFRWRIDQMNANGGTNYDNAFELAENILNGRVDDSRPTYVVFMSDGEPNEYWWLGWHYYDGQEAAARIRADGTTIYSLGLEIGNSAFNNFIRPLASGSSYAFNISNTNELSPIFASIAGEIKIAGTDAVITDYINTDYFEYVSHETDYGTVNVASDGKVTWNVGNITDTVKTLTINIRLKDSVVTAGNYETNFSADLEYVDYNNENKDKIFPVPVLDVGDTGYISMKYYLVNELGKPVTSDGLTELDFSQRIQLHSELFIDPDTNSENLSYNKAYTVEPPSTITINGEVYQYVPLSASNGGSPSSEVVILLPNSSSRTFNYGYMKQQLVTVNFDENYPDAPAPYSEVLNINTSLGQNMPPNPERIGYTFDGWFPNIDGSGNEFTSNTIVSEDITVYAKWSLRTDISYTVEYELSNGTKLLDDKVVGNKIFGTTVDEDAVAIPGYVVDEDSKSLTLGAEGNIITFIYSPREDISYTVEYELSDGTKLLDDKLVGNQIFGTTVDEDAEIIPGYVVDEDSKSLTLDVEDNVITFIYSPREDISYTVKYELSDGTKLLDDKLVENQIFGTTVNEDAEVIPGYVVDEDSKSLTLGVEDNVITFIYSPRADISYIVEYELEDGTKLIDDKLVENQEFGSTVNEDAVVILGYVVDEESKSLTLDVADNVITFVYTPREDISYTVEYELSDGTKLLDDKVVEDQVFGTTVDEEAEVIPGYVVDEDIKSLTLVAEGNIITFIYSPREDISYTVEYELEDGTKLLDDKIVGNQVFGTTVNEDAEIIPGYVVDEDSKSLTLDVEDNIITFIYSPRADISYTVEYELSDGTKLLDDKVVGNQIFGTTVNEDAEVIPGYVVDEDSKSLTLDVANNVITFIYSPRADISYTVKYELSDGTKLLDDKVVGNQIFGTTVNEDAVAISGYVVDEDSKSLTLGEEGNVITFIYSPRNDISYTVEYELSDGTKLLDDKIVENQIFGSTVNEDAVAIPGYVVDEDSKSLTLGAEGNVITFIYSPRNDISYTVEYELSDGTKLLDDKVIGNQVFGSTVDEDAEVIPGYVVDEDSKSLTLGVEDNVITFIYSPREDISYTVEYELEDGTKLLDDKLVENQIFGTTVGENAEIIPGYVVDEDNKSLTLGTEGNIITFIYSPRTDISYTVEYELSDGTKLLDDKIVENQIFGITVNEDAVAIPGYVVDEDIKSLTLDVEDNVITFIYSPRADISYIVEYELSDGTKLIDDKLVENQEFGSTVNEDAVVILGYVVDEESKSLILGAEANVITFVYTPRGDISYTVNYLEQGTNQVLAQQKVVEDQTFGSEITETAINIAGYNKVEPTEATITLDIEGNEITFFYTEIEQPEQPEEPEEPENPGGGGGGGSRDDDDDDDEVEILEEAVPQAAPELNIVDHIQYIQGYPDNTVRPEGLITREEVAAVFYRLLTDNYRESIWTQQEDFPDVNENRWSLRHIATLANGGIIEGYPDGSFRPGSFITRAELATIASKFDNLSPFESNSFSDIEGHWANRYINSASQKGWVTGYPDGTFKPNQYITRAEFVTLVNNVLGRRVHSEDILPEARRFPDLLEDKWYYEAMQEAIDSHFYIRLEDSYEEWTDIYYPVLDM